MPKNMTSLLAGRNKVPLTGDEIKRAANTFLGLDNGVNTRFDSSVATAFREVTENGKTYGEIVFGPDIYPGTSVVGPNSALSLNAAAAHELTHYYRWKDKLALDGDDLRHLDEALTSLQAIARYQLKLCESDVVQLTADAMQRIQLFLAEYENTESLPSDGLDPFGTNRIV